MDTNRKYNVGDRVVKFNIEFYDNPYFKNKFLEYSTVSAIYSYSASCWRGDVFYVYGHKHEVDSIGDSKSYQPYEFSDKTGRSTEYPYEDKWYHVEKDKEEIQQIIEKAKAEYASKCKEARLKAIAENKAKIEVLKREIAAYEEGDTYPCAFGKKKESEWNGEMNIIIKKCLGDNA